MIRAYEPHRDRNQLRGCIVELQEFERGLEPALPPGDEMADAHLDFLLARCAAPAGCVFVVEIDHTVVGFVGVRTGVPPEEPDEDRALYASITDLVVLPAYRRRGIGRALLDRAEAFARASGASSVRVGVLAKNLTAARLYRHVGFTDYHVQLVKRLS